MAAYDFSYPGFTSKDHFQRHIYRFRTRINRTYIAYADQYDHDIYVIKFHERNHGDSENKYSILLGDYDARNILDTCIEITGDILLNNALASFGFLGEPSEGERRERTKRYIVYSLYSNKYFNPKNFSHYYDDDKSAYFLRNITKPNLTEPYKLHLVR